MGKYDNIINNNEDDYTLSQQIGLARHHLKDLNDILEEYDVDEVLEDDIKEYMKEIVENIESYIEEIQESSEEIDEDDEEEDE